jgi:hypothetical protein
MMDIDYGYVIRTSQVSNEIPVPTLKDTVFGNEITMPEGKQLVMVVIGVADINEDVDANQLLNEMGWHHESEGE